MAEQGNDGRLLVITGAAGRIGTFYRQHLQNAGLLGNGNLEDAVRRRLDHMRAGHAYSHVRELPDSTVLEISGNPMPGGGFVTSYSNVTAHKSAEPSKIW